MIPATSALLLVAASTLTSAATWQPAVGATWQIDLSQKLTINAQSPSVSPDVSVFDIDMFTHNGTTVIPSLHQLGKKVICYFSAGSAENWRPDYSQFPKSAIGKPLAGWQGENWVNTNDQTVRTIMANRIKLASKMGCDAIDPDNMDAYNNDNGFSLTQNDAISYIKFLSTTAATYNMSTGLKNAMEIIPSVTSSIAFAVNEECSYYTECNTYSTFVKTKPVFHIEYYDDQSWTCAQAATLSGMSNIIKYMNLDGRVTLCPSGAKYTTAGS